MKTLYIIEDQTVLRGLVCRLVEEMNFVDLVGDSGDGREGFDACCELQPDLVIIDIMVPSMNGLEILRQLRKKFPNIRLLVFSGNTTRNHIQDAMKSGADGIVHKNASIDELEKAIDKVINGESYMSSQILEVMRDIMMNPQSADSEEGLTTREREILQLVAEGNSTKEIANQLGISAKTADTHRTNIMNKLNIHDVAGLTRFAIKNGIVEA